MADSKWSKNRTTTAERIAFLGVCLMACAALVAVTLWDCERRDALPAQDAAEATEVIVPVRADSVRKKPRRKKIKDSTAHHKKSRRKAAPKKAAAPRTPTPRDYTLTPEQEQ